MLTYILVMDLSNHAAVLEEIKRRFPLGCTVEDKDGFKNVITQHRLYNHSYKGDYIYIEKDEIQYWCFQGKGCYLYHKDTWSKVITPAQSILSPLQETFSKFINL